MDVKRVATIEIDSTMRSDSSMEGVAHNVVAVMLDDLDGDLASLRRVEGAAGGGIKRVAITIGVLPTVGPLIVGGKPPVRGALTGATCYTWSTLRPQVVDR